MCVRKRVCSAGPYLCPGSGTGHSIAPATVPSGCSSSSWPVRRAGAGSRRHASNDMDGMRLRRSAVVALTAALTVAPAPEPTPQDAKRIAWKPPSAAGVDAPRDCCEIRKTPCSSSTRACASASSSMAEVVVRMSFRSTLGLERQWGVHCTALSSAGPDGMHHLGCVQHGATAQGVLNPQFSM